MRDRSMVDRNDFEFKLSFQQTWRRGSDTQSDKDVGPKTGLRQITGERPESNSRGKAMTAVGRVWASSAGNIGRASSNLDARVADGRPIWISCPVLSLSLAPRGSAARVSGIQGTTPPPAG